MLGYVSSPFLREHETEMYGSQRSSLALLCGGMYAICRFQLHIVAAPGSAVFYSFYGFNERDAN